ncbi:MAG: helix-turn-helix transcriptional regulator, partial [Anaerolineaceae bacterium]|nr:helix-turn-helix transcriptional regulator [Anaerolineaceae bacterium]
YYLDIPLEHFWSSESISQKLHKQTAPRLEALLPLRNRIIGTSLRLFQKEANLSLAELAEKTEIPEETLRMYQSGEKGISIPALEILAAALNKRIDDFYDSKGPIGEWRTEQDTLQKFSELPPEMQQFFIKSVNRPYLQLAMRLSSLDVARLRLVAEGLLEITL